MCPVFPTSNQDGHQAKNRKKGDEHIFEREPSNDYFIKILFLLSKWFQKRRFLWEFPIGSHVKLSLPIATKLWRNDPWMAPFQNCVRCSRLPTKMATKLKIEKMGDEI
jgi:hypothetical protein